MEKIVVMNLPSFTSIKEDQFLLQRKDKGFAKQ